MSVVRKRILNTINEDTEPEDKINETVSAEKTNSAGKNIFLLQPEEPIICTTTIIFRIIRTFRISYI